MSMEDRIPQMTDKELENFRGNAARISEDKASKQQAEAARLLPIIDAALETRRTANAAAVVEKKRARQQSMAEARAKKAQAKKAAEEEKNA